MRANHRVQVSRRATAEDPFPQTTAAPAESASNGRDASLDWRISIPGVPAIVALARQLVRAALEDCPRRDDIELVTSELMTNAIRHTPSGEAGSLVTLRIRARAGRARIEVGDSGNASWAEPAPAAADAECGRGLGIIQMLADRAGHEPAAGGQVSWAEMHWDVLPIEQARFSTVSHT
jgi:anti-sigma regulatory factor (Ser/Thr protein kinase)